MWLGWEKTRSAYRSLERKLIGKWLFGGLRRRWEDNIKVVLWDGQWIQGYVE
jgi:hypothetical protein